MPQTSPASPSSPKPRPPVPRPWLAPKGGVSHVEGEREPPLWNLTIPQVLARAVAEGGDREAVVFRQPGIRWTWAQFGERVEALAAGFIGLGLKPGDRIGIWGAEHARVAADAVRDRPAGLILVCINPAYRLAELEYALNKVGCRALVTADTLQDSRLSRHAARAGAGAGATRARPTGGEAAAAPGDGDCHGGGRAMRHAAFRRRAQGDGAARQRARSTRSGRGGCSPDDAINIQFTSGTTGNPKGATLTHSQHRQQRPLRAGHAMRFTRAGPALPSRCRSITASAWSMAIDGLRHPRRDDGVSRPKGSTRWRRCRRVTGGALHRALRRADHVRRAARPPRVRPVRPVRACAPASWPARPARSS